MTQLRLGMGTLHIPGYHSVWTGPAPCPDWPCPYGSGHLQPAESSWHTHGTSGGFRLCHITGWSQASAPQSSRVKCALRWRVLWEISHCSVYTAVHMTLFCTKPLKSCQKSRFISPPWGYLILISLTLIFMYNCGGEQTTKIFCIREQIRHKFILKPSKMLISMFFSLL